MAYIISNKRIHAIFPTKMEIIRDQDCLIEDIKSIEHKSILGIESLVIKKNNGKNFRELDIFGHLKEVKEIVENIKDEEIV